MELTFKEAIPWVKESVQKIFPFEVIIDCYTEGDSLFKVCYAKKQLPYSNPIGQFIIVALDGGCNLSFGSVWLNEIFRNLGYGVKLHQLRLDLAKMFYAESVVATTRKDNEPQNRIMEHFKWNRGDLNKTHYIWYKEIV
jgi:hypothetical protein